MPSTLEAVNVVLACGSVLPHNLLIGLLCCFVLFYFFFQAEDGIRDSPVTGVQTCALPICPLAIDNESF